MAHSVDPAVPIRIWLVHFGDHQNLHRICVRAFSVRRLNDSAITIDGRIIELPSKIKPRGIELIQPNQYHEKDIKLIRHPRTAARRLPK